MKITSPSKTAWPVFLILLAAWGAQLACNLPAPWSAAVDPVVETVAVDPAKGSGTFKLTVTYSIAQSALERGAEINPIHCYFLTPDGSSMEIGQFNPPANAAQGSRDMAFSATETGNYVATCQPLNQRSSASASFTVENAYTASGQRTWDSLYWEQDPNLPQISHCTSTVAVKLVLQSDGKAWMQTVGEGKSGAKCEYYYRIHDDTQHMEWNLTGVYDAQTETATFTECNNTPGASGQVSYKGGVLSGSASCPASTDPQHTDLKVTITIP